MPGPVFLEGNEIALRTIEEEDLSFLQQAVNDQSVWRPIGSVDPVNAEQEQEFFENVVCNRETVDLLIADDETPAGIISLTPDDAEDDGAELGYWIASGHRRRGYASNAIERMVDYGFQQRGLHRISARVFECNEPSQQLLESTGFTHEGTNREAVFIDGTYQDVYWYSMLEHEYESENEHESENESENESESEHGSA